MLRARARRSRLITVVGVLAPSLVSLGVAAPAVEAAGPTCALVPAVQGTVVSQGVGAEYVPLARGKTTLLHVYLSKPSCASSKDVVSIVRGTVQAKNGTTVLGQASMYSPTTTLSLPPAYTLPNPTTTAWPDNPWDPTFVIPGSMVVPCPGSPATCDNAASFDLGLSASLTYAVNGVTQTSTLPVGVTPVKVSQRSNAIRVLVQPMGDARQPFDTQYSQAADAIVASGMQALSRIYPVPDGVGPLSGTTGGVRYAVNQSLLDLSAIPNAYDADGKFCGNSSGVWEGMRPQLSQFLSSWNAANPNQTADRIVGVVDSRFAKGSNFGCFEGQGEVGSNIAWLQLFPDGTTPSKSGALFGMELTHTFSLAKGIGYHSSNAKADTTSKGRAFNISTRKILANTDNHSVMNFADFSSPVSPWHQGNTLLEKADWTEALCYLGGNPATTCTVPGTTGTSTGVAAGSTFYMAGLTGGTMDTTVVVESFFSSAVQQCKVDGATAFGGSDACGPDGTSRYRITFEDANGALTSTNGVRVSALQEGHRGAGDGNTAVVLDELGQFRVAIPGEAAGKVEFWLCPEPLTSACKTDPRGTATLLYTRDKRDEPPTPVDTVVTPGGLTQLVTPANYESDGQLSPGGQYVAFVGRTPSADTGVYVAPLADLTAGVLLPESERGLSPAWSADGAFVAYERDGRLVRQQVDLSTTQVSFGPRNEAYAPRAAGSLLGTGALGTGLSAVGAVDAGTASCGYRALHAGTTSTGAVRVTARGRDGAQTWATDVPSLGGAATAKGVALAPDCSAWVVGSTLGSIGGTANGGGEDAFLLHLGEDGSVVATRQLPLDRDQEYAAVDTTTADPDAPASYEVLVVGTPSNRATITRFSSAAGPVGAPTSFGDLNTTGTGVAYADGIAYAVGSTGTTADGHGTVARLDLSDGTLTENQDPFLGTPLTTLSSLTVSEGELWVAGTVDDTASGTGIDVAFARLNPIDLSTAETGQLPVAGDELARGIAVADGAPVLLSARNVGGTPSTVVTATSYDGTSVLWESAPRAGLPASGAPVVYADHPLIAGVASGELWTGTTAGASTSWVKLLVTKDPAGAEPTFSPDGAELAFTLALPGQLGFPAADVAKVSAAGSGNPVTVLADSDTYAFGEPSWSHAPGVDRISFSSFALSFGGGCTDCATTTLSGGEYSGNDVAQISLSFDLRVWTMKGNGSQQVEIAQDVTEPSEGDDGQIVAATADESYTRTGLVRLSTTGEAPYPLTTGQDENPAGATAGIITFNRDGGLWALSLNSASTVTGRFRSAFPGLLRATLYYRCGGTLTVVAVGLVPTVSGSTATFRSRFDPSIACGTTSGELLFAATNGTTRVFGPSQQTVLTVPFKAPSAAIATPALNATVDRGETLALNGVVRDPEEGVLAGAATWTVLSASGTVLASGTGESYDAPPPPGGWPGTYVDVVLRGTDSAGTATSATRRVTVADTAPPALAVGHVPTGGAGYDKTVPVDVQITAIDSSGVAAVTCTDTRGGSTTPLTVTPAPNGSTSFDGGVEVSAEGTHVVTCTARDTGGRTSAPVTDTVLVDTVAPTVSVTTPTLNGKYLAGSTIATSFTCSDTPGSGVASCTGTTQLDTTPGAHTATFTATDSAGNTRTVSVPYSVGWTFVGFQTPVDNPPTVNGGKAGRTYPLKWQLKNANGSYASALANIKSVTYQKVSCTNWAIDPLDALPALNPGSSGLSYDLASNSYQYNWKTPSTTGCYLLTVSLNDGASTGYTAKFNLT